MDCRKYGTVIVILAMVLLAGCGRNSSEEAPVTPIVTAEPAVAPNTESTITNQSGDSKEGAVADPIQTDGPRQFTCVLQTEFTVPEGFIQLYEMPNIGYQYTFWHPDYEIRIVVNEIAPGYIPEEAYEKDYETARNNPDVTYFDHGENWFLQSGYNNNGEEIFYAKESSNDYGLKSFLITYPTEKREFGDLIATDFEKNCRF